MSPDKFAAEFLCEPIVRIVSSYKEILFYTESRILRIVPEDPRCELEYSLEVLPYDPTGNKG